MAKWVETQAMSRRERWAYRARVAGYMFLPKRVITWQLRRKK